MSKKITRRSFLKSGTTGAVAALGLPLIMHTNMERALAMPDSTNLTLIEYMNLFGINEQMLNAIIAEGLSRGGDYCDVYFEYTISNFVALEDNAVNRASTQVDLGMGVRVLLGDQTGYSFTEELTLEAMKQAAKTAANIAASGKKAGPVQLTLHETPNYYPILQKWEDVAIDKKIPMLYTINDKVFALDTRIIKNNVSLSDDTTFILLATSTGRIACDYRPLTRFNVFCTAEENGRREQNGYNLSGRYGYEYFNADKIDLLATEAVKRTVNLFTAVKPEAGEMPVVLGAGSSGILLHEAIGHGMEADYNRKKVSIFADKINKPVAESFVNIIDDGTNPNVRGSLNVDDEGNDTQKTVLVENGILRSYLHDHLSSQFYKVAPTGSGRRESFRFAPLPRMRNTYMQAGPHTHEEIIASVKKGLYAKSFTNGQVMIGAGDFTFYVKSGYLIEDGKLTKPVKDVNIIGNGPDVLRDIVMVGDDFEMDTGGWTCGKQSQRVPVSLGLPTVKVSKITVGGVNS